MIGAAIRTPVKRGWKKTIRARVMEILEQVYGQLRPALVPET